MGIIHCAKTILLRYQISDPSAVFCGGPNGNGVESSCFGNCDNACVDKDTLANRMGMIILDRYGIEVDFQVDLDKQ